METVDLERVSVTKSPFGVNLQSSSDDSNVGVAGGRYRIDCTQKWVYAPSCVYSIHTRSMPMLHVHCTIHACILL